MLIIAPKVRFKIKITYITWLCDKIGNQLMTATFRIQAKNFSLTYPQSDFSLEDGLTYLRNKTFVDATPIHVIICSETHADGTLHRHAYVKYARKINLRNQRFFDFGTSHPNIQATTNVNAWINYIKEDGDFLEWHSDAIAVQDNLFERARTLSEENYFEQARAERIPFGYVSHAWNHVNNDAATLTIHEDPASDLNHVFGQELGTFNLSRNLTNVIIGPTGCGKTLFAIRNLLKPILLISHVDDLKHLDPSLHKSILFDDMKFDHMPTTAQIHLCDRCLPRSIHRRYGTTTIPVSMQVAVTCNSEPFEWHPAIARRCNKIIIY